MPTTPAYKERLYKRTASSFLDLARIERASNLLGHPEKQLRAIHVAGTNGKGSVCHKLARNLELLGYKVGLYTSPHISCLRERIQVNRALISEEFLEKTVPLLPEELSFFEMMTMLAFLYFAEQKVDYAVIEVGLGGRLDATNILHPILSIITSIDYDHQALLGPTLEDIAREKAGILKEGVPYVLGPSAARYIPGGVVSLPGHNYDEENTNIVRKALELLQLPLCEEALAVRPPCRLQEVAGVILDVAHNPVGLKKLFAALPAAPYQAVVGMSSDKDIKASLEILSAHVAAVHFVKALGERGADPVLLRSLWPSLKPAFTYNTIEEGLSAAQSSGGPVLATGSFYIMAPIRRALGIEEPVDTEVFQESFKK